MPNPAGPMPGQATGLTDNLGLLLSSLATPEAQSLPGQQTTFPHQPMQMNPAFAQMIMQMLMQQQPNMSSLGALMGGA